MSNKNIQVADYVTCRISCGYITLSGPALAHYLHHVRRNGIYFLAMRTSIQNFNSFANYLVRDTDDDPSAQLLANVFI